MKISENLFKIARKDLEAAKCLYEKELYLQAVFYFQQSVEKANKSWALALDIIKEEEVTSVRHDPFKIYIKSLLEQKKRLEMNIETIKKVPELKKTKFMSNLDFEEYYKGVAELLTEVEKYYKVKGDSIREIKFSGELSEYAFIPEGVIRSILDQLNELELLEIYQKEISEKDFIKHKESFIEFLDAFRPRNPKKIDELKEDVEKSFTLELQKEIINELFQSFSIKNFRYVCSSLYLLSLIMLPHAIVTRYPVNNHDPLKFYNKNLPLIQLFDDMVKIMEKTLSKMENFYSKSKENQCMSEIKNSKCVY